MEPNDSLVVIDLSNDATAGFNIDQTIAERVDALCRT